MADQLIPARTVETGTCSFCEAEDVPLITPNQLRDEFEMLIGIYSQDSTGRPLVEILNEDWQIFDKARLNARQINKLLENILENRTIVTKAFVPIESAKSDVVERWTQLSDELKHTNRFFPNEKVDLELLGELLIPQLALTSSEIEKEWYRARIQDGEAVYSIEQMKAPPIHKALHGRANPAGIPYLYLASEPNTAISEIRPHTGEIASVAEIELDEGLKIIDLRNPRSRISPFILEDEPSIARLRGNIGFLDRLGEELTRPVLPRTAAYEYIPSQYLCEYVKKLGYDGVMYRSSVGSGENVALFNPLRARFHSVHPRRVTRVTVSEEPWTSGGA